MASLTRETAIACHREDMARLLDLIDGVPSERRETPVYRVWTLKDLLAHVAAWDEALLRAVDALVAGARPSFSRTSVFNKRAVDASRALTYGEVLGKMRSAHATLMERLERVSDEEWAGIAPRRWGDGTPMTVESLFAYTYKGETHSGGHAAEIEAWLSGQA